MEENEKKVEEEIEETEDETLTDDDLDETDIEKDSDDHTVEKDEVDNPKKRQSNEENKYYAEMRRRNKLLEKENEDLKSKVTKADFEARKKAISKDTLSELDLDGIEDENDLLLCETYEKAEKNGSENPVLDANKALRAKIRADEQKRISEEKTANENRKKLAEDRAEFKKKYGIDTSEALKDPVFVKLYGDMISYGNMTELYSRYLTVKSKSEEDKDDETAKNMGKIPNSSAKKTNNHKSINDLDGEDFLKAFDEKYN